MNHNLLVISYFVQVNTTNIQRRFRSENVTLRRHENECHSVHGREQLNKQQPRVEEASWIVNHYETPLL